MTKKQTMILIVLGIILSLAHVVAIPLMWKEWISVLGGLFLVGWGLFVRYEKKPILHPPHTNPVHIQDLNEPQP